MVATLFDERGRVVSSSCCVVLRGHSVDLERVRKLEIKTFDELGRKIIKYLKLLFGLLECSNNYSEYGSHIISPWQHIPSMHIV